MAKVEFTCSEDFKKMIKEIADRKQISVASFVKAAISDKIVELEKK